MKVALKKFCLCGCGQLLPVHWYKGRPHVFKFLKQHTRRGVGGFNPNLHLPRLCQCGCGQHTNKAGSCYYKFVKGHENRGRVSWNKGKPFSQESRQKMSLARMGKEPANKSPIDTELLYKLYVEDKKNTRLVSKELNVSYDSVKNRLRALGWSRSTKDSCSSEAFRNEMRKIRIKTLISKPFIESPNKLEKLVYNTLDSRGISYKKQAPLFNKFVVDVLIPSDNLVLEIFGRYWHEMPINKRKDFSKKKYLVKCGYKVEEVWDDEIKKEGVENILKKVLNKYSLWPE